MVDANEHVRFNKWLKIFEQSFQVRFRQKVDGRDGITLFSKECIE